MYSNLKFVSTSKAFNHETAVKAFLVDGDKCSKRTGRILAEFYLKIQYIRLLGSETTPGLHLSTSLALHLHLFSHPMCHQQSQRSSGHPFRKASRQTAITSISCSIWPHEILAFTTSAFPSFYSSYILAHFQVFTVQSHATQLTALCADAVMWATLPVSYFHFGLFLSRRRWGRFRCCVRICEGSCINPFWEVGRPRLFSQKIFKIPRPTPINKKRTFPYEKLLL